jgi:TfoX/Sxy family transcriptional regulator of competence genes
MPRPTAEDLAAFDALLPEHPEVTLRPMFGNAAGFARGQMFLCLFGSAIAVRLDDPGRTELLSHPGAEPFVPVEEGAELTFIDRYVSPDLTNVLSDAVVEIYLGNNARLRYVSLQDWGAGVTHLQVQRAEIGRDAEPAAREQVRVERRPALVPRCVGIAVDRDSDRRAGQDAGESTRGPVGSGRVGPGRVGSSTVPFPET